MRLTEPRSAIQKDSMDGALRNRIWTFILDRYLADDELSGFMETKGSSVYREVFCDFLELPLDAVDHFAGPATQAIRQRFYEMQWYEVYDLVEFLVATGTPKLRASTRDRLTAEMNEILAKQLSAYRLVQGQLVPLVDEQQISAVEEAMTTPLTGVRTHLDKALSLLARRDDPDIENSIKESISAVESLSSAIVGRRATLADALKKLTDSGVDLHGALTTGWVSLYGYTSDEHGVRHAMQDDANLTVDDAIYFLTTCSAFINLLAAKAAAAGIEIEPVRGRRPKKSQ